MKPPPGFSSEYAMYLYPDSISTYWLLYFFILVPLHILLDYLLVEKIKEMIWQKYAFGFALFVISYGLIYICGRRPVLDELWPLWPDTEKQKEYFKSVPARITFASYKNFNDYENIKKFHFDIKGKKKFCEKYAYIMDCCINSICSAKKIACLFSLQSLFFRRICFLKFNSYVKQPVYFNPQGSLQEGLLRAATADFFAAKTEKEFIYYIFIYYIPHVSVSFLYLFLNLLWSFRCHPFENQNETIPLVVLIIVWAMISIFVLLQQYSSIQFFYAYEEGMFRFSPKIVSFLVKRKMIKNYNFIKFFKPKKTMPIINAAAVAIYLAVLNLVLQYDKPEQKNDVEIEMNVKNKCKQVSVKVTESDSCETK